MSTTKKRAKPFLTSASTYWITLLRLGLIVQPFFDSSTFSFKLFYNQSFLSVFIRPHQCLSHLEEAYAIGRLATTKLSKGFSSVYLANNSIRAPPIILAIFSPLTKIGSNGGLFSILLLIIDILISYLIQQIGNQLFDSTSSTQLSGDDFIFSQTNRLASEEELQRQLPESIQPKFAHIFPIYSTGVNLPDPKLPFQGEFSKKEEINSIRSSEPAISLTSLPLLSAQIYYWSPFTILPTSLFYCWQNIPSLFLVASIYESISSSSSHGSLSMSSMYLAIATYLEPHHLAYLVPVIILSSVKNYKFLSHSSAVPLKWSSKTLKSAASFIILYVTWSSLLQGISYTLVGSENYRRVLINTYGNTWLNTSPNLSLQWYFRMQIFSRFRDYFGAIVAGIPFLIVGPLCLRFLKYPEILLACITMIWTIYRPVQVLYDANFAFCFFLFCPKSLARMGYTALIALCCLLVPVFLNIVDHWMWMDANNGNANYMFFQCLAYNIFLGIILGQFTSASMQREKTLRLTDKLVSRSSAGM